MAPSGNSAISVAASSPARSLPAATPPNFKKSFSLRSESLPVPTTIRRETFSPAGARISSVDPLLPLKWLLAARLTRSAAVPNTLRVVGPSFNVSSQKTTRMHRGAVENGTKPTLTASVISKSSKIRAVAGVDDPPGGTSNGLFPAAIYIRQERGPYYGLSAAALPSAPVTRQPQGRIINHIARVPWLSHFVDGSKGW